MWAVLFHQILGVSLSHHSSWFYLQYVNIWICLRMSLTIGLLPSIASSHQQQLYIVSGREGPFPAHIPESFNWRGQGPSVFKVSALLLNSGPFLRDNQGEDKCAIAKFPGLWWPKACFLVTWKNFIVQFIYTLPLSLPLPFILIFTPSQIKVFKNKAKEARVQD